MNSHSDYTGSRPLGKGSKRRHGENGKETYLANKSAMPTMMQAQRFSLRRPPAPSFAQTKQTDDRRPDLAFLRRMTLFQSLPMAVASPARNATSTYVLSVCVTSYRDRQSPTRRDGRPRGWFSAQRDSVMRVLVCPPYRWFGSTVCHGPLTCVRFSTGTISSSYSSLARVATTTSSSSRE
jgi:hypothetical protein